MTDPLRDALKDMCDKADRRESLRRTEGSRPVPARLGVDTLRYLLESYPAAALPHLRVQETASKCLDCEHTHTPAGCIGEPSPSDVWAGVTPSICDCPSLRVQETCGHDWQPYWDGSLGYRATDSCTHCHAYRPTPHPRPVVDRDAVDQLLEDHGVGVRKFRTSTEVDTHRAQIARAVLALLPTEEGEGS